MDKIYRLIKLLLYIAKEEGVEVTPAKLHKIFFLLQEEKGVNLGLNFIPFFFSVYSPELQNYVDKLVELGDVEDVVEEVRDPITDVIITYKRRYVLKCEFKPKKEEKEVAEFFRKWISYDSE